MAGPGRELSAALAKQPVGKIHKAASRLRVLVLVLELGASLSLSERDGQSARLEQAQKTQDITTALK